jgi:CubicO group peptidase (beta-lactamase class C family)
MKYCIIIYIGLVFLVGSSIGQTSDIIKSDGIVSPFHQQHIGRIFFSAGEIPAVQSGDFDFLTSYTLTNKSDLHFLALMGNSITNYLHGLDPSLPADSLVKYGNFQFRLYIDNKLIYESNLMPGAPYAAIQHKATIINKPLIDNKNGYGLWSESFWNRFMRNGGDSVLTDGPHLMRMEIRPYLKQREIRVGELIAAGQLNLLVARNPVIDISKINLSQVKPYSGLEKSSEQFDAGRIRELKGKIDEGIFKKITSIVVIKNGKILIEEYFNKATRETLHDTRSVGKSFASTFVGMAIHDGYLKTESQPLSAFYDFSKYQNFAAAKGRQTLQDLLTMRSAFDGNDSDGDSPGNEENMYPTVNWVKFALDLPVLQGSDNVWHYFTAGVVLLGDIINRSVPGGMEQYADQKFFKPLGIASYKWQYTPQKVPNTAGGLQMRALDFAKYGQLYKNGGSWKGKQLIPRDWVHKSFTTQTSIPGRENEYYGYLFWNKTFVSKGKNYEAFYCAGNGGNYVLMFTNQPLVIVITSTAYGQSYAHPQSNRIITDYLLPAIF